MGQVLVPSRENGFLMALWEANRWLLTAESAITVFPRSGRAFLAIILVCEHHEEIKGEQGLKELTI